MSDQPTADAPATDAPATDTPDAPKPTETVEFWKQKAREQESRAKANAEAAKRLAAIEDSNRSETEKVAARIAELEAEASTARAEALRFRIANEFSLSGEDAGALEHVTSEEGMRAVAQRLGAKADQTKKQGNYVPREGSSTTTVEGEKAAFARQIFTPGD